MTSQLSSRSELKPAKLSVTFSVRGGKVNKVTEALIAVQRQTLSCGRGQLPGESV